MIDMNPNHSEQPNLSLPALPQELPLAGSGEHQPNGAAPELKPLPPVPSLSDTPTSMPITIAAVPLSSTTAQTDDSSSTASVPTVADDGDLIEKEWVEKAKAIVSGTKNDPFQQSKKVNHFKADYMKKRYNKDIKVPEA